MSNLAEYPGRIRRFEFHYDATTGPARDPLTIYVIVVTQDGKPIRIETPGQDTGSFESGLLRSFFDSINLHLAHGMTLAELAPLFSGAKFEPTCMIQGHVANSPLHALFEWMSEAWPASAGTP